MKPNVLVLNPRDNVAIALTDIKKSEIAVISAEQTFEVVEEIPFSHKIALINIPQGTAIFKYGEIIGTANCSIKQGAWVHAHNLGE